MARIFQPQKKTKLDTKHRSVLVEKLDHHGAGIAYLNRKPLFIEGALPGEEVVTQLVESKSKFSRGKLIKILKPSEQRTEPFCPHYARCGGCDLQHLAYEEQVAHKQTTLKQLMGKFARTEIEPAAPVQGKALGYRRRARISLMLDKKSGKLQFGFRQKRSKQIENVTDCPVLTPELNQMLAPLHLLLSSFKRQEALGHIELVLGDGGVCILLRHTQPLTAANQQALEAFAEQHQATLYLMPSSEELNLVVGETPFYQENGAVMPFAPNNFIQVNQEVNRQMVEQAMAWLSLQSNDRVLDLFCGLGNFSLPMAKHVQHVVGVEGVADMVEKANRNAQDNGIENVDFYHANLAEEFEGQTWAKEKFDKILLDPARAGASGIIDQVSLLGAQCVVYVSCNPATLARDSQSLLEQGYQLEKVGMLDMFPHTSHLESMALFRRQSN